MQKYPHHYPARTTGKADGTIVLSSAELPDLAIHAPPEFDGPGGYWSPETLFVGAVVSCFVLTFRSIAKASNFPYENIECNALGVLDRVERVSKFTEIQLDVTLELANGGDAEKAQRLLEKAESACLITNSLSTHVKLATSIQQV